MMKLPRFGWLATLAAAMLVAAGSSQPAPVDGAKWFSSVAASGGTWTELGPTNVSGRALVVAIHPNNPSKIWVGTQGGGIWHTANGGTTWAPVDDRLEHLVISDIQFDPVDPNIMYVSTGAAYPTAKDHAFNDFYGGELLKSIDGGTTWSALPLPTYLYSINKIAVSPSDHNIIMVGCDFKGPNRAWEWRSILRSTNGGASWTEDPGSSHTVLFHPTNGTGALASNDIQQSAPNHDSFCASYSTDSGATWTKANGMDYKPGRVELAYSRSNPTTVYAARHNGESTTGAIEVFRSTDSGASYSLRGSVSVGRRDVGDRGALWVDPTDDNRILVGWKHVYMSTDGGTFFTQISDGGVVTAQPHLDIHSIVSVPGYNGTTVKTVYLGTSGGLFKADDITAASTTSGWTYIPGLRSVQALSVAGDGPTMKVFAGTSDNGVLLMDGGSTASSVFAGDGHASSVVRHPSNPNSLFSLEFERYLNETVYGPRYLQVYRSTDGGATTQRILNGAGQPDCQVSDIPPPLAVDPSNPDRLFAGGLALWRTSDSMSDNPTWNPIKPSVGFPITAITVAPNNPDIIWVGHENGHVYMTANGTATTPIWTTIDNNSSPDPFPFTYYWNITRILVDSTNTDVVYVCIRGEWHTNQNVWKTTDGGASWTLLGAHAPGYTWTIARHPDDPDKLWLGTDDGVCYSTDGGATWGPTSDGPANVMVTELAWMHNSRKLLAATHGRGVWVLTLPSELASVSVPASIRSGASGTGTVVLTDPAPAGGLVVSLSCDPAKLDVPATVMVPEGQSSGTFAITAGNVAADTGVTVTATAGAVARQATTTVLAHALSNLAIPSTLASAGTGTGTVSLGYNAPAGGVAVGLSSNAAALSVPATVTVPAGSNSVNFTLTASAVTQNTEATVTASVNSSTKTATTTILAQAITLSAPATLGSGWSATATVTLATPAPAGGAVVTLSQTPTALTFPASVTIPAGSNSRSFTVTGKVVTSTTSVDFAASYAGKTNHTAVEVLPPVIQITLSAYQFVGAGQTNLTATIGCGIRAPAGGLTIDLKSSNPAVVSAPATVTIPAGGFTVVVPLTHYRTGRATNVILTAKYGNSTTPKGMWVYQPNVTSVVVTPDPIVGGSATSLKATVTIEAAAPAGGSLVVMSSSDPTAAWIAGSLLIPAGRTSHVVYIRHYPVVSAKTITIKGTTNKVAISDTVVVNRPNLYGNAVVPNTVVGGSTTVVTGKVILGAPAPAGGMTVALASNKQTVATVPASVFVPAGAKEATYPITHKKVGATTTVTITASLNGVNKNGYLAVYP